jgi:hypothetical protein
MKVMCISHASAWPIVNKSHPEIGEICTVINLVRDSGSEWYVFLEYDQRWGYNPDNFAPISEQDNLQLTEEEAEQIRKRQKQLI